MTSRWLHRKIVLNSIGWNRPVFEFPAKLLFDVLPTFG